MGQGMIIGELAPLSFHTFLLFKYPIRVKLTQNILREILDISLDYWWLRYKCLSDMGGFSLGWNLTKSAFGLSIEFRGLELAEQHQFRHNSELLILIFLYNFL